MSYANWNILQCLLVIQWSTDETTDRPTDQKKKRKTKNCKRFTLCTQNFALFPPTVEPKWKQNYEIIKQLINNHAELIIKNKTKKGNMFYTCGYFNLNLEKLRKLYSKQIKKIWNFWVFSLEYAKEIITDA